MEVLIENLTFYNEGIIRGGWYKMGESTEENLQKFLSEKVGIDDNHPTTFIADYEQIDLLYCPNEF